MNRFTSSCALLALLLSVVVPATPALAQGPVRVASSPDTYLFPGRGASLGPGQWWVVTEFSEGPNILDLHVRRWDRDRWSRRQEGVTQAAYDASPTNDKHLVYGLSLYAPADGEIYSCWRNAPDNPIPGQKLPEVNGSGVDVPKTINAGGNHVNILTDDGRLIGLAHLKPDSVPPDLCPNNQSHFADGTNPVEALVPVGSRARVRRGQRVGEVGNSGNSEAPHLHISVHASVGGANVPIPFYGAWAQTYSANVAASPNIWTPLQGDALVCNTYVTNTEGDEVCTNGPSLIWPSPFLRRGDAGAGAVSEVAVAGAGSGVVTAVRDGSGNLKLITWTVGADGAVTRNRDAEAGAASQIALAHPGFTRDVVTALRDEGGNLKLIGWGISESGAISRQQQASAGPVSRIAVTRVPTGGTGVVTAVRTGDGDLKLIAWEVESGSRAIVRRGDAAAGPVSEIALAGVVDGRGAAEEGTNANRFTGVVTAVRDGSGALKLIAWEVTPQLQLVRRGEASAGAVSAVSIAAVRTSNLRELVVTAVRDGSGELRLIAWEVSASGQLTRRGTAEAGRVSAVEALAVPPPGGSNPMALVTAVRADDGDLKLIGWDVDAAGQIARRGDAAAGAVSALAATTLTRGGKPFLAGAFRTGSGALKLIAWEINPK